MHMKAITWLVFNAVLSFDFGGCCKDNDPYIIVAVYLMANLIVALS